MTDQQPVTPADSRTDNQLKTKKSNTTVWLILLSFAAPVILAYVIFFFVDVDSYTNHGEILNPIVQIGDFELKDADGKLIPVDKLTYKWRLISFLDKHCNQACQSRLHDSRQIHTSLGKDRHRVNRMFVHLESADNELKTLIDSEHPGVIHVYGDAQHIESVIGHSKNGNGPMLHDNIIYIMDPMGNVMMRFTQDQPNKDLLYDLRKLLKASQIG